MAKYAGHSQVVTIEAVDLPGFVPWLRRILLAEFAENRYGRAVSASR